VKRRALLAVLALLLVLAALVATGYRVLRGENGSALVGALVAEWLPELTLAGLEGSLARGRARTLGWERDGVQVVLHDVAWELAPDCAGLRRVCISRLVAARLDITTPERGGDGDPGFELAAPAWPVTIELRDAAIGTLVLLPGSGEPLRATQLGGAATLRGSTLELRSLHVRHGDLRGELAGSFGLRERLPLDATGSIAREGEPALALSFAGRGDLRRLELRAQGEAPWPLEAEGWIEPLKDGVPLALQVRARESLALGPAQAGELADAELSVEGSLDTATVTLEATLRAGLAGDNRLRAKASIDRAGLQLREGVLEGEAGRVQGTGGVSFASPYPWRLELALGAARVPGLAARFDARLDGSVRLAGEIAAAVPLGDAELALVGVINTLPAALEGRIRAGPERSLRLEALQFASGPNRLRVDGVAGERLALDGQLVLEDLGATVRGAAGHGTGELRLRGTRAAPQLQALLELREAAWSDWRASAVRVEASAEEDSVQVSATLQGEGASLALDCNSRRGGPGQWQGSCARIDAETPWGPDAWRLAQPARFALGDAGLAVEPFCLVAGDASLCSRRRALFAPAGWSDLLVEGHALSLAPLARWLPADVETRGTADLSLELARAKDGTLALDARASAATLRLGLPAAGRELPLELAAAEVALGLRGAQTTLTARAQVGAAGHIDARLAAQGRDADAALSGTIDLATIDAAPLMRMAQGTLEARGTLAGRVDLAGSVSAPRLAGRLVLADGAITHERLPEPLQDIALAVDFEGPRARIDGRFVTAAGPARLAGSALWGETDWTADLRLDAERLRIEPLRGSTLSLVPALAIRLGPQRAEISGTLEVPAATIDLATVPQSAASVSDDAIEEGAPPAGPRFDYALDLAVRLGDAVQFRGFGAEARLTGGLRLRRAPGAPLNARGEIRVEDGRYAAWGQRLEISEGQLLFRGALDRPQLRIDAVRRIEDEPVTVGVRVRGTAKQAELSVFSRPAMPESRALHYLLSGRPPAPGESAGLGAAGALVSIGAAGATQLTGGVLGKLGIADFEIGTRSVEGGTEVLLGGYITPDLYLRYGVSTLENVNTFRLRYRLTPKVFVEAISGIENAVDFLYSFER
jgi:translocation and assembly module TamB